MPHAITDIKDPARLRDILTHRFPDAAGPSQNLSATILTTGTAPFDALFAGHGLPYGQLIEITGGVSSGKTSLALKLLAALTNGHPAIYTDLPRSFFPAAAVAAGVDLERLWVTIPNTLPDGLRTVELLLSHHLVRGAVLDLVGQKEPPSQTLLHRLRQQTARAKAIVIFLTQTNRARTGHLISPSTVSLRLEVKRLDTARSEIMITKSRLCREGIRLEVSL